MSKLQKWYVERLAGKSTTVELVDDSNPVHAAVCSVGDQATLIGERDEVQGRAESLWLLLRRNADEDEAREALRDETA